MPDERISLEMRMETPLGPIAATVAIDPAPMRLAQLVPFAQSLASAIVARAVRCDEQHGQRVSCRAGCGACCRQLVPISAPEAFFFADLVAELPEPRRDVVRARFEAARAHFAQTDLSDALGALADHARDKERYNVVGAAYFSHGVACPFLDEESCSIHPARPIACRDYNVTTPAARCSAPLLHRIRRVPTPPSLSPSLARLTARLAGEPLHMIPLALALEWCAAHGELGARAWPGVDLFRAFVEEVSRPC